MSHHLDPIFKELLVKTIDHAGVSVETQVEVSRLPRTIDGIITVTDSAALPKLAVNTPFDWLRHTNVIAFKGRNAPLTEDDFHMILGRGYMAISEKSIAARDATFTIICGRTPRNELHRLQDDLSLTKFSDGVYQIGNGHPNLYLVVINDLPQHEERYGMLYLFTSRKMRFQEFVSRAFTDERYDILELAVKVHPKWTQEIALFSFDSFPRIDASKFRGQYKIELLPEFEEWMVEEFLPYLSRKRRLAGLPPSELLKDLSPEDRLEGLSLEDRLEGLSPEDRLKGLPPEERLKGLPPEERLEGLSLEERLEGLSPSELAKLRQQLNSLDSAD